MGFFRGSFLAFTCFLLFISLLAMNIFLTLSTSLEYENVQKEISPLAHELVDDPQKAFGTINIGEFDVSKVTEEANLAMKEYCQNNTDYTFSFESHTISIPCSSLEGGIESVVNETLRDIVEGIYYAEYDCNFFKCLTTGKLPLFLISEKARDYWHEKFKFALIASIVLVVLIFLLVERKLNWPVLTGIILILSTLPLLKLEDLIAFLIPEKLNIISLFLKIFFSKVYTVFWMSFISGLVLAGLGIGLKFSNSEFVKELVEKFDKKPDKKDSDKKGNAKKDGKKDDD